jgi:serine/threonine protein kinase/tetratricopeptide (TPR) repeat protein
LTNSDSTPGAHSRPGERIGRYELVEALGKGAMGVVYYAYDPLLDRDVALKLMLPQIADEPDQKHRFEREARAVARLMHPNVVTLFDLGYHTDGSPYIAMELLRGEDLLRAMRESRPFTLQQKISILVQVLDGLGHAHQAGIVHRDIKPANIFLMQDGPAKIMDFGVARFTAGAGTGSGAVVGTVEYMSPEQVQGAHVDGRSDVFSAACVLCELVTGRRPFHAESLVAILYKIANEKPQIDLPAGREYDLLRPVLARALASNPDERFQTAAEFATELRAYMRTLAEGAPAADVPTPEPADTMAVTAPRLDPALRPPTPVPPTPVPRSQAPPLDATELFRLMREIYIGGKSGHLHFTHGSARRGLRFVSGHIVMGTSDVPGEHLGNVLVRFGVLAQAQLEKATEILLRDRKRLGTVLAELGIVPRERMTEGVGLHVREILFNVMDQPGGSCVFEETGADAILGPDLTVRIAPGEIILEATRRIQDPHAIARVVGSMDRVLMLSSHPLLRVQRIPLTPTDGFLLSRVDGTLSAREVFQLIPLPHEDVERSLFGLLCTGSLEYLAPAPPARSPGTGGAPRPLSSASGAATGTFAAPPPRPVPPPAVAAPQAPRSPAPGAVPPTASGRVRPPTDDSQAGRDLQAEQEKVRRTIEELRLRIVDTFQQMRSKDHFELLGIERAASANEIKDAYFRLCKPFHPDAYRNQGLDDLKDMREAVFIRLGEAYDTLRHPESRARYERQYQPRSRPHPPAAPPPPAPPPPAAPAVVSPAPPRPAVSVPAPAYVPSFEPPSFENPVQAAMVELKRAEGLLKQGKYWDAIQVAEPLLETVSGALLVRTRLLLGHAYLKNPNWLKRAAEQLQTAIESDPRNAEAHFALGLVYKASGLAQRAAAMFRKALELMPGHAEALRELNAIEPAARRKLFSR